MPSRNIVKKFAPNEIYHIYNRGVEKRTIFPDKKDYHVFTRLLELSLSGEKPDFMEYTRVKDKSESLELIAYCLMPNHFHFLIKLLDESGMTEFMRSISNAYVAYFNKKYKRVGSLFQGTYKAALVDKDEYLIHLSRYIHMNPLDINQKLEEYPYSSYKYFLDNESALTWVKPAAVLEQFNNPHEYKQFVEDYKIDSLKILKDVILD